MCALQWSSACHLSIMSLSVHIILTLHVNKDWFGRNSLRFLVDLKLPTKRKIKTTCKYEWKLNYACHPIFQLKTPLTHSISHFALILPKKEENNEKSTYLRKKCRQRHNPIHSKHCFLLHMINSVKNMKNKTFFCNQWHLTVNKYT